MTVLTKVGRIITCGLLRCEPQDDEEVYDELLHRSNQQLQQQEQQQQQRVSVANAVARFEQSSHHDETTTNENSQLSSDHHNDLSPTCSQKAKSGFSLLFGFMTGATATSRVEDNTHNSNITATNSGDSNNHNSAKSFRVKPAKKEPNCRVCSQKIFPTDESTTCRNNTYHAGCFKCTLCGAKLKNHPDERHEVMEAGTTDNHHEYMLLQCRRCKVDNEHKYKPRQKSRVAGEKTVLDDSEKGDIDQVVDAIGDDLEEAIYSMIPRCATCGADFLKYKGEISMVGSLKYHKECFLTGRPSATTASMLTLDPAQAAKYLPDTVIVRMTTASTNKILTTLYFIWKDKDQALKAMRGTEHGEEGIVVTLNLDDEARANPNHKSNRNNPKRNQMQLPQHPGGDGDENLDLSVDLVGADQIAPQPPRLLNPVSIASGYQNSPSLQANIGYSKYNLQHTLLLNIPCNATCEVLDLLGATLTVKIQEGSV